MCSSLEKEMSRTSLQNEFPSYSMFEDALTCFITLEYATMSVTLHNKLRYSPYQKVSKS